MIHVASKAKANEHDTSLLETESEMRTDKERYFERLCFYLKIVCNELNVKLSTEQTKCVLMGVMALLAEGNFLDELFAFQHQHPGSPMPADFRAKMIAAI